MTAELDAADASYYHLFIGIIRSVVELGIIDITCEISMLSSHLELPREGHLEEVLHVFAYLKKDMNSKIVLIRQILRLIWISSRSKIAGSLSTHLQDKN